MMRRIHVNGELVLRWRFPDLDPAVESAAAGQIVVEPASVAAPPQEAAESIDERAFGEEVECEITSGYAQGFERGIVEGRATGQAEGFAAGVQAGRLALAGEARRIAAILDRLDGPLPAVEGAIEDALVTLALEIARCVVGGEIARSHDSLVRLIREALAKLPVMLGGVRVLLNPADLQMVREAAPEIEEAGATLIGDPAIEAGGCRVIADGETAAADRGWRPARTDDGVSEVDLTLATRWRNVLLALFADENP